LQPCHGCVRQRVKQAPLPPAEPGHAPEEPFPRGLVIAGFQKAIGAGQIGYIALALGDVTLPLRAKIQRGADGEARQKADQDGGQQSEWKLLADSVNRGGPDGTHR